MKDDVTALAKVRLEELLTFFGINTSVKVAELEERVELRVEAPDSAKLIGHHGENLRAIQHLLNMMLRGTNRERTFVDVDVDGYKKARGEQIMTKATATAKTGGRPRSRRATLVTRTPDGTKRETRTCGYVPENRP